MRSIVTLLALFALVGCNRQRDVVLQLNNFEGQVRAYVYPGSLGCELPYVHFTDGQPPDGFATDFDIPDGAFASPELGPGDYTVLVTAIDECELRAVGCTEFGLARDRRVIVDAWLLRPPMASCAAEGCCEGDDAGVEDAGGGGATCPPGSDGLACRTVDGADGTCCDGACGTAACCGAVGEACVFEQGDGICCETARSLECRLLVDCSCEGREGTQCEDGGVFGTCVGDLCDTSGASVCAPPLIPAGSECELTVVGASAIPDGMAIDLLFYQLDQNFAVESLLGQAVSYAVMQPHSFALGGPPSEAAQICSRAGGCTMGCPCDAIAEPRLALAAVVAGTDQGGSIRLPYTETGQELLVVWANRDLDQATLEATPQFSRLGFGSSIFFEEEIPAGYSAWRLTTGAAMAARFSRHLTDPQVNFRTCSGCLPLPPR